MYCYINTHTYIYIYIYINIYSLNISYISNTVHIMNTNAHLKKPYIVHIIHNYGGSMKI